ncbi:hypothetical protein [Brevibacillus borstelensis]|uniref:hypothetical protein n=1 Tax=Brevibacillus borstelensis TaxID=45462 RepID=UPI00287F9565|nr:hypothetical protein [Brevibacillus borstelensis]WNF07450.1 hypothetical protein RFB14_08600 [Brevibacillus borstelensis]
MMEVKLIHGKDWNDAASLEIEVNGKTEISAYPLYECPEDATLERDLNFVYDIPDLMRQAYEAGRNGEPFVITEVDEEAE